MRRGIFDARARRRSPNTTDFCVALATLWVARAEASSRGGPQLPLLLGPAGFNPFCKRIAGLGRPVRATFRAGAARHSKAGRVYPKRIARGFSRGM